MGKPSFKLNQMDRQFCQALAQQYPEATKIRLVQDNLRRFLEKKIPFLKRECAAKPRTLSSKMGIIIPGNLLNTHNASSFYEHLPAPAAFALAQRFEFYYTPKSASWLNMIEIEFSALARGALHRRISTYAMSTIFGSSQLLVKRPSLEIDDHDFENSFLSHDETLSQQV